MSRLFSSTNRYFSSLSRPFPPKELPLKIGKGHLPTTHVVCEFCTIDRDETHLSKFSENQKKILSNSVRRSSLQKLHNRVLSEEEIKADIKLSQKYEKSSNEHDGDTFGRYSTSGNTAYSSRRHSYNRVSTEQESRNSDHRMRSQRGGRAESVLGALYEDSRPTGSDFHRVKLGRGWSKKFGTLGANISDSTDLNSNPRNHEVTS